MKLLVQISPCIQCIHARLIRPPFATTLRKFSLVQIVVKIQFFWSFKIFVIFIFAFSPSQLVFDYAPYNVRICLHCLVSLLNGHWPTWNWQSSRRPQKDVFGCCKIMAGSHHQNMILHTCQNFSEFKSLWFLFPSSHLECKKMRKFAPHENFPLYNITFKFLYLKWMRIKITNNIWKQYTTINANSISSSRFST